MGRASCAPGILSLTAEVLARVLGLCPRQLDLLLVCKHFHAALTACPAWWRALLVVPLRTARLAGGADAGTATLLRGFRRVARLVQQRLQLDDGGDVLGTTGCARLLGAAWAEGAQPLEAALRLGREVIEIAPLAQVRPAAELCSVALFSSAG